MKRISIGTWAYTIGPYEKNPVDFDTVCRNLIEYNFDGVELGGFRPHPNPDDLPEKSQRDEIVGKMKDWGLEFSGLAANLWGEKLLNTDDQSHYISEFTKNCDFCVDLGIRTIRVDTVQPPTIFEQIDYDTAFKRITDTWKSCSAIAAERGLNVAWEFEPGFAFNKPSDILRILDKVNHDNFGVLFDACHGYTVACVGARQPGKKEILAGGVLELARKLRGKINHIHLIDSDGTLHNEETSTHVPFGEGKVDFDTLLAELGENDIGHDWWTIDLCFWPDAWVVTEKCKKAVDNLNRKYGG